MTFVDLGNGLIMTRVFGRESYALRYGDELVAWLCGRNAD